MKERVDSQIYLEEKKKGSPNVKGFLRFKLDLDLFGIKDPAERVASVLQWSSSSRTGKELSSPKLQSPFAVFILQLPSFSLPITSPIHILKASTYKRKTC